MTMKCKVGASGVGGTCENKTRKRASSFVAGPEEAGGSLNLCVPLFFKQLPFTFHLVSRLHFQRFLLLVLLLLLFEQFVELPLGHGCVLGDDAVLVQARQQQQEAHCGGNNNISFQTRLDLLEALLYVVPETLWPTGSPDYCCDDVKQNNDTTPLTTTLVRPTECFP